MSVKILHGDARQVLKSLPERSVQACVTSPPYFGLRSYLPDGHPDKHLEIGLEPTPDEYVAEMVAVFREVRRVLRDDGVLWLNLGDSYAGGGGFSVTAPSTASSKSGKYGALGGLKAGDIKPSADVKAKDLLGIPWMVAFALRIDGWFLRAENIWATPNPMPESVTDRPTRAHEHVFLLTKSARYFYDADAVRQPASDALIQQINEGYAGVDSKDFASVGAQSASGTKARIIANARAKIDKQRGHGRRHAGFNERWDGLTRDEQMALGSNLRSVWTIAAKPFSGSHFATMPPALAERCILAGSHAGDTVLDPFSGAGTTALVADRLGRSAIGIELNPEYAAMGANRVTDDSPLFAQVAAQ